MRKSLENMPPNLIVTLCILPCPEGNSPGMPNIGKLMYALWADELPDDDWPSLCTAHHCRIAVECKRGVRGMDKTHCEDQASIPGAQDLSRLVGQPPAATVAGVLAGKPEGHWPGQPAPGLVALAKELRAILSRKSRKIYQKPRIHRNFLLLTNWHFLEENQHIIKVYSPL